MSARRLFLLMVFAMMIAALLSLKLGAQSISWAALGQSWQTTADAHFVVIEYRLPRLVLAMLVGAALAVSGVLVQGLIRNPLASPDILGVNHAASLMTLSALLLFPALPVFWLPLLAFGGGCLALLILRMLVDFSAPLRLAVVGIALAACWASLTDYLMLSRPQDVNMALLWLTGSLWGRDWTMVMLALPVPLLLLSSLRFSRDLDLLALGDERAATLGVNLAVVQRWALMLAVALAAIAVAICGPISFISLVVPHLVRHVVGGRHRRVLPLAALGGGLLLVLADLLARTLAPPMELPAGVITALLGAPCFFWLLIRMR
ncbi:iron-dicitrate transporter subunit FecD [Pantoea rodasii]|uniref:Iron-dicitrate transporter subunit FecD n=1 Tax=Pantoea rodasii TaxID=1076549 RepID=A0A2M9W5Z8_9GAMM|nr:Fe(3+) dicitrate ABC transporter permease subunit FecD [Pantoea rodasii]ORM65328.1 iron-dicitrate transporter subunit FecD [Pantoea rodasii]PJZ02961.1 iron-dicitrate transporter subunit FecD [Pantoea rodasii]